MDHRTPTAALPFVAPDLAALTAGATERVPVRTGDAKSGSSFERVVIDDERYFLKSLSYEDDWIMRVTGDVDHRQFKVWQAGIYQRFPAVIDHTIVAMAVDGAQPHPRLGILMHDIGPWLVPEGDQAISEEMHRAFISHMAQLHAALWGFRDTLALTPMAHRSRFFAPDVIAPELARADVSPVVQAAHAGWGRLPERSPALAELVTAVHRRPEPLAAALAATPATFLPGDWKMGNLGRHPDGRTILLDCAYPGEGPGCWDLAWYLALNRSRLPISKEETIRWYRDELARAGIDVAGWFDRQMALCLLSIAATFGWEKALGDDAELAWWADRALAAERLLPVGWRTA